MMQTLIPLYKDANLEILAFALRNHPRTGKPCPKCSKPSQKNGCEFIRVDNDSKHLIDMKQRYQCPECNYKWRDQ